MCMHSQNFCFRQSGVELKHLPVHYYSDKPIEVYKGRDAQPHVG